jgi:hypothetical protein
MGYFSGPKIVTNGLVFAVDAASARSYPGSGTTATDLAGTSTITLDNGVGFSNTNEGTFVFDGSDDEINTNLTTAYNDFSCVVIFKDNGSAAWGRLVDKSYSAGFFITAYQATVGAGYVGGGVIVPGSPHGQALIYDRTKYNYFVMTRSGTTQSIYLNGSAATASFTGSSAAMDTTSMSIGSWSGATTSQRYTGDIAVVKTYNRALTTAEIDQDFNAYRNRFGI